MILQGKKHEASLHPNFYTKASIGICGSCTKLKLRETLHLARIVKMIIDQEFGCQVKVSMISFFSRYPLS